MRYQIIAGLGIFGALIVTPVVEAQEANLPSRPGDLELGCPALAVEMGKAAQLLTNAAPAAAPSGAVLANAGTESAGAKGALATLTKAVGGSDAMQEMGRAYQQQQNAQQLANLQTLAARGGVNRGAATAAIGGLAALQQVAANGGNVQEAARSAAGDAVGNELAKRLPGGKMLGGLMGGMFKKKPKPVPVVAAVAPADNGAQARLAFLSALVTAKGCK